MRIRFVLTALAGFVGIAACCAVASARDYGDYRARAEDRAYKREIAYQKYLESRRRRHEAWAAKREDAYQRYLVKQRERADHRAFERSRRYGRYWDYGRHWRYHRHHHAHRSYNRYPVYDRYCCEPYRAPIFAPVVYSYSFHSDLCLP